MVHHKLEEILQRYLSKSDLWTMDRGLARQRQRYFEMLNRADSNHLRIGRPIRPGSDTQDSGYYLHLNAGEA